MSILFVQGLAIYGAIALIGDWIRWLRIADERVRHRPQIDN